MRILLIEDERELSDAIVEILRASHYEVDAVYDGLDGYDYLAVGNYDGAVLDLMLPGMDGITLLQKLRKEGNTTPVLILSAKSEVDDRVKGLDVGADDYLTKPFATKELLARVRAITRRGTEASSSVLSFGNTTLDTTTFTVNALDSCTLQNKEFQLLQSLMSNPEQILSSERLFEKIWGYDTEAGNNNLWVYISNLRKRLESIGSDVKIKAVRNQGYTLVQK